MVPLSLFIVSLAALLAFINCQDINNNNGIPSPSTELMSQKRVYEGQDIVLECVAKNKLQDQVGQYSVQWFKRTRNTEGSWPVPNATLTRYSVIPGKESFYISPTVLEKDEGLYVCIVSPTSYKSERFSPSSSTVDLTVLRRTHIVVQPEDRKIGN